jgi:chorismate dehydratase
VTEAPQVKPIRIASVSYYNAKPLVHDLEGDAGIALSYHVPARLLDALRAGEADVALLPVIDYQRMPGLRVIPAGGIGCDGPTLTVRIFSHVPVKRIKSLACDGDSHTSVALARVLLAETYGIKPPLLPLAERSRADAVLLIGDKVVCEEPQGYAHQLDLGAGWKKLTGLPFVFAVWTAVPGLALGNLLDRLVQAKRRGLADPDALVARYAVPRGWPPKIARQYVTEYLQYDIGLRHLEAIRLFHQYAAKYALIDSPPRALVVEA